MKYYALLKSSDRSGMLKGQAGMPDLQLLIYFTHRTDICVSS
mgnify:CR=1 FL=1